MRNTDVESVCVFGSAARSSSDQLSDRDVLIVASDNRRRRSLLDHWRKSGWSVASYSPSRLLKMISAGSLFIQHLKLEGILVSDQNGWLQRALESAERKQCYMLDARASVSLAAPIERFASETLVPHAPIVADLAYVALRNFGICYLADKGKLTFDYYEIVDSIGSDFGLGEREMRLARSLRAGKAAYRGFGNGDEISGTVDELRSLLSRFFVQRPLRKIQREVPVRDLGSGYAVLRDFEAVVESGLREDHVERRTALPQRKGIFNWIRNPRSYAWEVRNLSVDDVERIRTQLEAPGIPTNGSQIVHSGWSRSVAIARQRRAFSSVFHASM